MKARSIVAVMAGVAGVALGLLFALPQTDEDVFLRGLSSRRTDYQTVDPAVSRARQYLVSAPVGEVVRRITSAFPTQISRRVGDDVSITIPREQDGRVILLPPARQTILVRDVRGRTEVVIREFRRPSPLDGAMVWLQRVLRV